MKAGDIVEVVRDISRIEDAHYAKEGEQGIVVKLFNGYMAGYRSKVTHVQVRMDYDAKLKTFRLTSLKRLD